MKSLSIGCLLVLAICLFSPCAAQYSHIPPEELTQENYSRKEIRQYLMHLEDDDKVRDLAAQANWSRVQSNLFVGFAVIGALYAINAHSNLNENGLIDYTKTHRNIGIGVGVLFTGLAIWQNSKSNKTLEKALLEYSR